MQAVQRLAHLSSRPAPAGLPLLLSRRAARPAIAQRCGSGDLSFRGVGTEQVEREVIETFPAARISRMDVDTTSVKWSHHDILGRVERGEVDILLGTQMIAKGLDFPGCHAGRGRQRRRGHEPARLSRRRTHVSAADPGGGARRARTAWWRSHDSDCAAQSLRDSQRTRTRLSRLCRARARGASEHLPTRRTCVWPTLWSAARISRPFRTRWRKPPRGWVQCWTRHATVQLVGPAPCPIDRIRGRWRWHFLLRSGSAGALSAACRHLFLRFNIKPGRAELRMVIDRDPVSLL